MAICPLTNEGYASQRVIDPVGVFWGSVAQHSLNYIDHHRPCVGQQWPNSKCQGRSHQTCEENPTCILLSCCSCFVSFQEKVGFLLSCPRGLFAGFFYNPGIIMWLILNTPNRKKLNVRKILEAVNQKPAGKLVFIPKIVRLRHHPVRNQRRWLVIWMNFNRDRPQSYAIG